MSEKKTMDAKYLTLKQASEMIQMPVRSLRKRIDEGKLTAYKPGRSLLIDPRDLELLVKRSKVS